MQHVDLWSGRHLHRLAYLCTHFEAIMNKVGFIPRRRSLKITLNCFVAILH